MSPFGDSIGKFGACSTSPDHPSFAATFQWESALQQTTSNASVFGRTTNLYVTDRCFVPRRLCRFEVFKTGSTLLLPREGPSLIHVLPRQYDVVLGAAQVVGTLVRRSFATLMEQSDGGLPVINLGKGAAGPHIYTDDANWPRIAPILTNARSVIICIMAGRSSPNAESGRFSGNSFGAEQLQNFDRVNALWNGGAQQRRKGDRLRRSSLSNAQEAYMELVRRIRAGDGGGPPSRVLLVWFSKCPISGCSELWQYPQYYLRDLVDEGARPTSRAPAPIASAVSDLHATLEVELVDASYEKLPPSPPLPMDQCMHCVSSASTQAVCNSVRARNDAWQASRICGARCGSVYDTYYPDDNAHEHAAAKILATLRRNPNVSPTPTPKRLSLPALSGEEVRLVDALPSISLAAKLFHSHVHKASGTSFIAYVAGMEGVTDCAMAPPHIILNDHTRPSSWPQLQRWWTDTDARCNFVSIEEPELGEVFSRIERHTARKGGGDGRWIAGASGDRSVIGAAAPPQAIGFFRHPFARCRSHWKYEQALCHRPTLGYHAQYCNDYFLPRFGAYNDSATHHAFVAQYCTEHASRGLGATNGIRTKPYHFALETFSFIGITEHFLESVCLFLYQAGRFRRDLCTCDSVGGALEIGRELQKADPREAELQRQGAVGIPALQLSDDQLKSRSPRDLEMYAVLVHTLERRVRLLESAVNASVWGCNSQIK